MNNKSNSSNSFYLVIYLFLALFLGMMGYFAYYVQFKSIEEVNNSYNTRQENLAKRIVRGNITDRNGNVLAGTKIDADGNETRVYPYGESFAHVVGYSSRGRTGIEQLENISLLTSNANIGERIQKEIADEKNMGDTIVSTLDLELQQVADEALGENKGAVIALDPSTGEVLAMVSHPSFNPNDIVKNWDELNSMNVEAPLLNRAISGLYPPGSTFKIVTLLEYLRENEDPNEYSYKCTGSFSKDDSTIRCYHGSVHGKVDLENSFAKSCNASFANIGSSLRKSSFRKTAEDLLFNKELPIKLNYQKSQFDLDSDSDMDKLLQLSIGQGSTLISPMHLALITAAIANDGLMEKPYFVDRIENYEGLVVKQYKPTVYRRIMSSKEASLIASYMRAATDYGTAKELNNGHYPVYGKTGSAEFSTATADSHAWFTGYAQFKDKKLVVTVIAEAAGSGSKVAVPIAKEVFDKYYE